MLTFASFYPLLRHFCSLLARFRHLWPDSVLPGPDSVFPGPDSVLPGPDSGFLGLTPASTGPTPASPGPIPGFSRASQARFQASPELPEPDSRLPELPEPDSRLPEVSQRWSRRLSEVSQRCPRETGGRRGRLPSQGTSQVKDGSRMADGEIWMDTGQPDSPGWRRCTRGGVPCPVYPACIHHPSYLPVLPCPMYLPVYVLYVLCALCVHRLGGPGSRSEPRSALPAGLPRLPRKQVRVAQKRQKWPGKPPCSALRDYPVLGASWLPWASLGLEQASRRH